MRTPVTVRAQPDVLQQVDFLSGADADGHFVLLPVDASDFGRGRFVERNAHVGACALPVVVDAQVEGHSSVGQFPFSNAYFHTNFVEGYAARIRSGGTGKYVTCFGECD